ncbi:DNA-binding GntR family transcriptional regulator [Arthrobacter pigmenti]|uniref:DNA-binding GntR family transcriptional regulator n=1 Tax=Arthrobacter pigmenti TaxID=271432 RepID=A0A846RFR6_9MICC|nr:DNA-binding GntR family transcriptional regulator [Arthrobacter pigmenti]
MQESRAGSVRASDRAYETLRSDIIEWRLSPGTVLGELEQSARLGVSRTPLREALSRLTAEGLTAAHRGRGVVVSDISLEKISELFAVRISLDCTAATLAAERSDQDIFNTLTIRFETASTLISSSSGEQHEYYRLVAELDSAIDAAAANPYLLQAQKQLRTHLSRVRRLARDDAARLLASAAEHAQIARSIAQGNADLASASTKVHLHNSLQYLLAARIDPGSTTRKETAHG